MNLQQTYQSACLSYIKAFEKKQGYEFTDWIGSYDIAIFIDQYFINLSDVRFDIDEDVPAGTIIEWYDATLEVGLLGETIINYRSWVKGARYAT